MKTRIASIAPLVGISLAILSGKAHAEGFHLGGTFSILPIGQLHFEAQNMSESVDTAVAYSFGGIVEYKLHPNIGIGVTPRVILNVKGEDADESAKQLDLLFRLAAGGRVARQVDLYAFVAPGYSILYIPDLPDEVDDPAGLVFHFGGGAGFDLTPTFRLAAEIGYQLGNQGFTEQGVDVDVNTSFLQLGFLAMARL